MPLRAGTLAGHRLTPGKGTVILRASSNVPSADIYVLIDRVDTSDPVDLPATSSPGIERVTELTVHTLTLHVQRTERRVALHVRAVAGASTLRTCRDESRAPSLIIGLIRQERPMLYYGFLGALIAIIGVRIGFPSDH